MKCRRLSRKMTQIIIPFKFNAEGVVPLIAQGWRQPTLGYACSVEVNAVGVVRFLRGTTPSVLRFLSVIHHKGFHCKCAFTEKAQHLRRWISLRTFTRGRLVPRQPRAIKSTTRTELRDETIVMLISLIIKRKTICVISSCKIRQTTQGRLRFRSPTLGYQRYNAYSVAISINTGCVSIA